MNAIGELRACVRRINEYYFCTDKEKFLPNYNVRNDLFTVISLIDKCRNGPNCPYNFDCRYLHVDETIYQEVKQLVEATEQSKKEREKQKRQEEASEDDETTTTTSDSSEDDECRPLTKEEQNELIQKFGVIKQEDVFNQPNAVRVNRNARSATLHQNNENVRNEDEHEDEYDNLTENDDSEEDAEDYDDDEDEDDHPLSEGTFNRLPTYKFCASSKPVECSVCKCNIEVNEQVVCLPCAHIYHVECIKKWLTEEKGSCPVCKTVINVKN